SPTATRENTAETRAVHPALLIRGIIEWKIARPADRVEEDVEAAIRIAKGVYSNDPTVKDQLEEFYKYVARYMPGMFDMTVEQPKDETTWEATNPLFSYATAQKLAYDNKGEEMLLIALGHGGTAAGLDVFLRYWDITETHSDFYVVRFSRHKSFDETPQLTDEEIKILQDKARGKHVVLFDEDTFGGKTLKDAQRYFRSRVFKQTPAAATNMVIGSFGEQQKDSSSHKNP